jgi:hypothetical protein
MIGRLPYRRTHVAALALCATMLPWSTAFLSMAQVLLAANWLAWGAASGALRSRMRTAFTHPPVVVFLSFLGLYVAGLAWTTDLGWGLDLVRILLPVLVFGVILGGGPKLEAPELHVILLLGAWSAVASALLSIALADPTLGDHRALSRFISHIRLSLLLCIAIVVFIHTMPREWLWRAVHVAGVGAAVYALDRLESVQAAVILALITGVMLWRQAARWSRAGWIVKATLIATPMVGLVWLTRMWEQSTRLPLPGEAGAGEYTPGGEPYEFDLTRPQQENGMHVWTYLARHEAERVWIRRTGRPLDSLDARGEVLLGTLARYMTSLGLRKDSAGVTALSEADVEAILAGHTNAHRMGPDGLYDRLVDLMQEMAEYRVTGRADGRTLALRLEYLRTGLAIAKAHWVLGVGTGDTQRAFDAEYDRSDSPLDARWRLRAHNLFLTWAISFGVFGAAWLVFSIVWPAWRMGAWHEPLFIAWAITFGVSCLSDDTVETQAGATFFALYYALLVFAPARPSASKAATT